MHPEHICERLGPDQFVGLAVARTGHGNMHIGITYQWRGSLYLYHQAFHVDTRLEPFDAGIASLGGAALVVALSFRPARQRAIAGFLDSLGKVDPQYPYSLELDQKAVLDKDLGTLVTVDGKGLSCVTFVLAVLESSKVRLVDASTWPKDRPEDRKAQDWLCAMLDKHPKATPEHRQAVRKEIGCVRVRPEEAGGAGCYKVVPVKFTESELASLHLLKRISRLLNLPAYQVYPEAN